MRWLIGIVRNDYTSQVDPENQMPGPDGDLWVANCEDMRRGYWRLVRVGRSSLEKTLEISLFILGLTEKYS